MIRDSQIYELPALMQLHRLAFGADEGNSVAGLVEDMFNGNESGDLISLVALGDQSNEPVGHIAYSPVSLLRAKETLKGYMLSPLAVNPKFQTKGIGTNLIKVGLEKAKNRGASFAVVYGNPSYYGRYGFNTEHQVRAPYELQRPFGWQAISFENEFLVGDLKCIPAFDDPAYW